MHLVKLPSTWQHEAFKTDLPGALRDVAETIVRRLGAMPDPVVVIIRADDTAETWVLSLRSIDYSIVAAETGLRLFLADKGAVAYGVAAETWGIKRATLTDIPDSIADEPDRQEMVLITGQTTAKAEFNFAYAIERDADGNATGLGADFFAGANSRGGWGRLLDPVTVQ